ncbi:VWA domain-containing protein [Conexibacter sp. SYSU D00693]|uniref:VWA domain-containing protein n=1 Tax=Conexibacter sp. SYSU D00693 TaxID=2812560 RepID=UPI00196A944A|nr:VWA domain-containing protein [Conexibacter sp. SYSU D00693]
MSFASPWLLLALLAVPPALWAYVVRSRREGRAAAAFVTRPLRASVQPRRARWRRHLPAGLFGLALTALLVAPARPQAKVEVPAEQATIVLATDVSGSMQARDVAPSRLAAARSAAKAFASDVPEQIRLAVVAFNHTPSVLQAPTTDRAAVEDALDRLKPSGGTATGDALQASLDLLPARSGTGGKRAPQAVVLLSDGTSTRGRDVRTVAARAKELGVPVSTIALGTATGTIQVTDRHGTTRTEAVPPDPATLAQVARTTGGEAFRTADAKALSAVYDRLGSQLGRKTETRELTQGLAGAAMLLALAGSLLSLRWFRSPA